ncbi:MAG: HepT-like ribonuclease domain-containing protein [Flavobacterium sp.]
MDNNIKTWLFDILSSINEIESYFVNQSMQFQNYQKDLRTKRAVERNIEIIGEAMNRILKENNEIQISDSRKIVAVRNRIIHGYDSVSDEVIWGIVIKQLPLLKAEVEKMLSE